MAQGSKVKRKAIARPKRKTHAVAIADQAADSRRAEMTAYCWSLHCEEYSYREIAALTKDRFKLKNICHTTVEGWVKATLAELVETSKDYAERWKARTLALNARLIKSWFAKALHETEFAIARMEKVVGGAAGGMEVEVIDEAAFKERAMAVDRVLKIQEQNRRILGVGLADTKDADDVGKLTLIQVNNIVMNAIGGQAQKPGGRLGEQLVIEAGDAEVEGI